MRRSSSARSSRCRAARWPRACAPRGRPATSRCSGRSRAPLGYRHAHRRPGARSRTSRASRSARSPTAAPRPRRRAAPRWSPAPCWRRDSGSRCARWRATRVAVSAPARLGGADRSSVAAAVSPGGHAVVAWVQRRGIETSTRGGGSSPRAGCPAADFGPLEALTPWRRGGEFGDPGSPRRSTPRGSRRLRGRCRPGTAAASAASSAVDARARRRERRSRSSASPRPCEHVSRPALAVAPDGWALLAYDDDERAPRARAAAGSGRLHRGLQRAAAGGCSRPTWTRPSSPSATAAAAWWRGARAATIDTPAWPRPSAPPPGRSRGRARSRRTPGSQRERRERLRRRRRRAADRQPQRRPARGAGRPTAARCWRGRPSAAASCARTPRRAALAAGFGAPARLGSPVRDVNGVAPLFLADGRAAVAWTDNASRFGFGIATDHGRLHLAVESGPAVPEARRAAGQADREAYPATVRLAGGAGARRLRPRVRSARRRVGRGRLPRSRAAWRARERYACRLGLRRRSRAHRARAACGFTCGRRLRAATRSPRPRCACASCAARRCRCPRRSTCAPSGGRRRSWCPGTRRRPRAVPSTA